LTLGVSQKTYTKSQPLNLKDHTVQNMEQFKTNTRHVLKHYFFPYAKKHKHWSFFPFNFTTPSRKRSKEHQNITP